MNKTEFLDLLRYYFRNAKTEDVNEILSDYEAHFEEGMKRGLTEEAIAKELGSPKDIYESYAAEGMVDEKNKGTPLKDQAEKAASQAAQKLGNTWKEVSPKLPEAANGAALLMARLLYGAGIVLALLLIVSTILVLALLSIEFAPLPGVAPLPGLHLVTMISIGAAGLFASLSILFIGLEGSKALKGSFPPKEEKETPKGGDLT
ncbi:MAG TPA: hypothetical protein DDY92_04285 [Dialister sp.]|nr:hypothetical protein [Dialister sp.]